MNRLNLWIFTKGVCRLPLFCLGWIVGLVVFTLAIPADLIRQWLRKDSVKEEGSASVNADNLD